MIGSIFKLNIKKNSQHTKNFLHHDPHHPLAIFFEILPGGGGGHGAKIVLPFEQFFWYSIYKYFQLNFAKFQGAIWKISSQSFQNRSYFLKYVVLRIAKLSPKLSTYRWDTLYKVFNWFISFYIWQQTIFVFDSAVHTVQCSVATQCMAIWVLLITKDLRPTKRVKVKYSQIMFL